MVHNSRMTCVVATIVVAFVVSGCQSSNSRWATAWKERSKPKPKFQGLDDKEEVTYWPYKADKSRSKIALPDQLKEKLAKKSEQNKQDAQLSELIQHGDQLRKSGQLEEARIAYSQALMIWSENPAVHHRMAIVADKQKQFSVADEHYQVALRANPRDVGLLSDLGYSYMLRGNNSQAEQTLKQALEIDRSHKGAMSNLGTLYAQQNRRDEALAMFRAGANESEAMQLMDRTFSANRFGPGTGGPARDSRVVASNDVDLTKLSFEQIQAEMARRRQDAQHKRYEADQRELNLARQYSAGAELQQMQQQEQQQQLPKPINLGNSGNQQSIVSNRGMVSQDDEWGGPIAAEANDRSQRSIGPASNGQYSAASGTPNSGTSNPQLANGQKPAGQFEIIRGNPTRLQPGLAMEPQSQQQMAAVQQNAVGNYSQQQFTVNSASQVATQLGMSAGPGSLFPVLASPGKDGVPTADSTHSYSHRFGGEFQQPPNFQNSQNWSGNQIEQASGSSSSESPQVSGAPSIVPASPANQWSTPSNGRLNWQTENSSSPSWANDLPNSGAAGTGLDSGAGQLLRTPSADLKVDSFEQNNMGTDSQFRRRNGTEASRPYTGTWPSRNSIPDRQNVNGNADGVDVRSFNSQSVGNGFGQSSQNSTSGSAATTLPQWPYAPGR